MSSSKTCTHIKVNGVQCGSPALSGEQFCYFHQRMHRGVRTPPETRLHPMALIEDEESIQAALMEVINALMRNRIDLKRASLILRALHIAVKNAQRVHFGMHKSEMVDKIPHYKSPDEIPVGPHTAVSLYDDPPALPVPAGSLPRNPANKPPSYADAHAKKADAHDTAYPSVLTDEPTCVSDPELDLPPVTATAPKPLHETDPKFWERHELGTELEARSRKQRAANQAAAAAKVAAAVPSTVRHMGTSNLPNVSTAASGTPTNVGTAVPVNVGTTQAHVGTAALGCPSRAEVPLRSNETKTQTQTLPNHNFQKGANQQPPRKPPTTAPIPKTPTKATGKGTTSSRAATTAR